MPGRATTEGSGTGPSAMLRSQHAEATRRSVLAAARSAFGRKGYAQASVDEIADAARVTKGAVYHHFAGKEALFRAVHAEVEADAQARAWLGGVLIARASDPGMASVVGPPAQELLHGRRERTGPRASRIVLRASAT